MLYTFAVLKDGQPTKNIVFASNAESEDDAKFRIRKANLLGDGESFGATILDTESEAA